MKIEHIQQLKKIRLKFNKYLHAYCNSCMRSKTTHKVQTQVKTFRLIKTKCEKEKKADVRIFIYIKSNFQDENH